MSSQSGENDVYELSIDKRETIISASDDNGEKAYAESIVEKHMYDDFGVLLKERAPWMLPGYEKALLEAGEDGMRLLEGETPQTDNIKTALEVADTSMYGHSRVARKIQYLFDSNVIRVWNEEALEHAREIAGSVSAAEDEAVGKRQLEG